MALRRDEAAGGEAPGLEDELKAHARGLGLDLVGIAGAGPFTELAGTLNDRAGRGLYPPFTERDVGRRVDPQRWLAEARSLIVAGVSYLVSEAPQPAADAADGPRGQLSRYCRGSDYHDLLHDLMGQLIAWLDQRVPGHRYAAFCDTGPAVDRAVAERAGLGWFGRHTNLISRAHGSWVLWGEIATTLELLPDPPLSGSCGTCRRCVDACPTGAILDLQGTLDPNRCVGYLTQMKGAVPAELRPGMGSLVFGCDICQDVCPYNHAALAGEHPEFLPRPELGAQPDLGRLLRMTKGQFRRWFRGSAAAWRGRVTLRRNAAIALGNSRDERALPLLAASLAEDGHPLVRGHAAWGLGQLGAELGGENAAAARTALEARLDAEEDASVRREIEVALGRLRGKNPGAGGDSASAAVYATQRRSR